jgi:hypothetical protein
MNAHGASAKGRELIKLFPIDWNAWNVAHGSLWRRVTSTFARCDTRMLRAFGGLKALGRAIGDWDDPLIPSGHHVAI